MRMDIFVVVFQLARPVWLGLQHTRPPCPSPSPEVYPSSCPLYWWCYPGISSSDALFSFCPQFFPASVTFPMSQLFTSDNQNTGVSASASLLPTSIPGWFDLLAVQETQSILQHHSLKASVFQCSSFFTVQLSQLNMITEKSIALIIQTFVGRVMFLLFNTPSRFVIAFLPRSNHLLISWLQSPSAVILEPKKGKSVTISTVPLLFAMKEWCWVPWS